MAFNDAFGIFGHYAFSSKPTHGRAIYESITESLGDSYSSDFSSVQAARAYANAMCLASAQYQLDRSLNNRDVSKATELLTQLEKDYQVTPGPNDTIKQRRDFLSAIVKVSKGNSYDAIRSSLETLLGSDFVSYTHLPISMFPEHPERTGVFSVPTEPPKRFMLTDRVSIVGTPIDLNFTLLDGFDAPMAGEDYTVDPDPRSTIEKITIISSTSSSIRAIFTRSHEPNTIAVRPYPFWSSHARYNVVTVKLAIAQDAEKRRKINELMARASRGVSQWAVVSDQGNFILDSTTHGVLGSTTLA